MLATLRIIHANPKAAGVRKGFHDLYSNYGHYERLVGDGLSEWHPAFLQLAPTLGGVRRPPGAALGWQAGGTAAAAMAAADGNVQADKGARASDWEANFMA